MAKGPEELIIDLVEFRLKRIYTSNSFNTDAGSDIHRWKSQFNDQNKMPAINIVPATEIPVTRKDNKKNQFSWDITVEGILQGGCGIAELSLLKEDIISAMMTDQFDPAEYADAYDDFDIVSAGMRFAQDVSKEFSGCLVKFNVKYTATTNPERT